MPVLGLHFALDSSAMARRPLIDFLIRRLQRSGCVLVNYHNAQRHLARNVHRPNRTARMTLDGVGTARASTDAPLM